MAVGQQGIVNHFEISLMYKEKVENKTVKYNKKIVLETLDFAMAQNDMEMLMESRGIDTKNYKIKSIKPSSITEFINSSDEIQECDALFIGSITVLEDNLDNDKVIKYKESLLVTASSLEDGIAKIKVHMRNSRLDYEFHGISASNVNEVHTANKGTQIFE